MYYVWWRYEILAGLWWGILKERDHLEYLGIDGITMFSFKNQMGHCELD